MDMKRTLFAALAGALILSGCASSGLVLTDKGVVTATLDIVPGTTDLTTKVVGLKEAMEKACEGKTLVLPSLPPGDKAAFTAAELQQWLAALKTLHGFLGKTTISLAGWCED